MDNLTSIKRIGNIKHSGSEWSIISKKIVLENTPEKAIIRIDSVGVCGIFVNGKFLEATTGRYVNRICAFEFTSLLNKGENLIELKLGNHFYQPVFNNVFASSGKMFSSVAAEIIIDGKTTVTDMSWQCEDELHFFSEVTKAEYERFWITSALWNEQKDIEVNDAVKALIGSDYNPNEKTNGIIEIKDLIYDNIYELGRLYVGYLLVDYEAETDSKITFTFDYTESVNDLINEMPIIKRLKIVEDVKKGNHSHIVLRRRAFRFLKVTCDENVKIKSIKLILSMKPNNSLGHFESEDEILNRAWQVGKYTLLVNMHQEYESCPRNEMKFFSGDAIIEALVDYYTFNDGSLVDSSMSLTEIASNLGLRHDTVERNVGLWDYPAWRILIAYNHYLYFNDTDFVKKYFDELTTCLNWLIEKMNSRYLIYQFPVFSAPMYQDCSPVEYNSSPDRLGEKPLLNALLYKCLLVMAEFSDILSDSQGEKWRNLAQNVKDAINEHLWSEDKKAYLDGYDTTYIPEDGNAVAVLFGISDEKRTKEILETLKKETWTPYGASMINSDSLKIRDEYRTISPVMNMYEAEARFLNEDEENALDLIKRCWGGMLKKGAETFWEFISNDETKRWHIPAHGWASGCCYLFGAYVLGIRPNKSGYEEVLFSPAETLENYKGVVPTKKGLIAVKKENGKYTIAIPKSVKLITEVKNVEIIEY